MRAIMRTHGCATFKPQDWKRIRDKAQKIMSTEERQSEGITLASTAGNLTQQYWAGNIHSGE